MNIKNCRICDQKLNEQITIKEMQLGLREDFSYGVCSSCGCIQIMEVPADLEKYYPPYYGPFNTKVPLLKNLPPFKRMVRSIRMKQKYKKGNNATLNYLGRINASISAKILDIGCGNGELICSLYNYGFKNVEGVDKFLPEEIDYGHGVKVRKKDLSEFKAQDYDVIMMHHVLEHIEEQADILRECYRLLKAEGTLLIRIPIVGDAYKIYAEKWVQLDAPRHFIIHTLKSMDILAKKEGFLIEQVVYDSNLFQFAGSEMYEKNISILDPISQKYYDFNRFFSKNEMEDFENKAVKLNEQGTGDQAIFYLKKAN
ncbi:class I SAM-dependent methyltransferase [Mucilaginibacter sp.]